MIALVLFVAFGIAYAVFATQNTGTVSVWFGQYVLHDVPIYLALLVSFAAGLLFSSIFYGVKTLSSLFTLRKGHADLKDARREIAELNKELHKLELDNTRLQSRSDESDDDETL